MQQLIQVQQLVPPGVIAYTGRGDYQTRTGQQAPAYDANLLGSGVGAIKRWVASGLNPANPNAPYAFQYLGLDAQGQPAVLKMTIPAGIAMKLNLPGALAYQDYSSWLQARGGTNSVHVFSFMDQQIRRPITQAEWPLLLTPQEASALAAEIGNGAKVVDVSTDAFNQGFVWDPTDPRRVQDIVVGSWRGSAGYLFRDRSAAAGVGAPGSWTITADGPKFTATTPATGQTETRVIPLPIRDLAADEKPVFGGPFIPDQIVVQKGSDAIGAAIPADLEQLIRDTHDRVVRIDNLLPR